MDVPWVQILVYAQPVLWLWLWDRDGFYVPPWIVVVGGSIAAAAVYLSGLNYGFYTTEILIFYILAVTYVAYHYRDRPSLHPICLGFLVVFINSFYWELPIHVADFLEFDSFGVVAVQALHLWPLPFLLKKTSFEVDPRWWYSSAVAWTVIAVISVLNLQRVVVGEAWTLALMLCRSVGLYGLLSILRFPGYGEKVIFKLRERLPV